VGNSTRPPSTAGQKKTTNDRSNSKAASRISRLALLEGQGDDLLRML